MLMITGTPQASSQSAAQGRRIGLSLSGGGFRASLFHIGVLARLAELDLLRQVDVLSCVSGGSIVGALYYLYLKRELDAHGEIDTPRLIEVVDEMERHLLAVVQQNLRWRVFANLASNIRLARADYSRTDRFGDMLDRHLYRPIWGGDKNRPVEMRSLEIHPRGQRDFNPITDNMQRHCKVPMLVINATTLNTGHNWRFGVDRMGEPPRSKTGRQVDKNWQLGQSPYNGLTHDYADMPLGQAVAASAAVPGFFEPFPLRRLYPHPERSKRHLQTQLVDGGIYDNLGTEVLIERGCTHFLVSDASGQLLDVAEPDTRIGPTIGRSRDILMDRVRELQIARMLDKQPRHTVLIHMMREAQTPELKPIGPADHGHIIKDRGETDVTSFGVERRVQALLARMRTDLDAFSDTEALALMADGYLLTKRNFEELEQKRMSWIDGPAYPSIGWRFSPLFEELRQPSPRFLKRLNAARFRFFKGQKLVPRLRFEAGLVLLAITLGLAALAAAFVSGHIVIEPVDLALIELAFILAILAYPAYQALRTAANATKFLSFLKGPLNLLGGASTIALALPLFIISRAHLYAGRLFLRAGALAKIGIDPERSPVKAKSREGNQPRRRQGTREAA
ncbi:MAG: patatin-like phospholipase family protein [Geminicoccales bacterium]